MTGWPRVFAHVARGRAPKELADVAGVTPAAVYHWRVGRRIPGAVAWRALVVSAGMEDDWAALSAARDEAEKPRGRPVLSERERLLRRRDRLDVELEQLTQGADVPKGAS